MELARGSADRSFLVRAAIMPTGAVRYHRLLASAVSLRRRSVEPGPRCLDRLCPAFDLLLDEAGEIGLAHLADVQAELPEPGRKGRIVERGLDGGVQLFDDCRGQA